LTHLAYKTRLHTDPHTDQVYIQPPTAGSWH